MFKRVILYLTLIVTAVLILFAVLNRRNTHSLVPLFGAPSEQTVEQTVKLPADVVEDEQEPSAEPQSDAAQLDTPAVETLSVE